MIFVHYCYPILTKTAEFQNTSVKLPNIKVHTNSFSGFAVVTTGRADKHDEAKTPIFATFVANTPKESTCARTENRRFT
jgi:hypothetical protein